jgi:hypothetical protein
LHIEVEAVKNFAIAVLHAQISTGNDRNLVR